MSVIFIQSWRETSWHLENRDISYFRYQQKYYFNCNTHIYNSHFFLHPLIFVARKNSLRDFIVFFKYESLRLYSDILYGLHLHERLSAGKRLPVCIAKVVICLWHDKNLNKGFIKIFFVESYSHFPSFIDNSIFKNFGKNVIIYSIFYFRSTFAILVTYFAFISMSVSFSVLKFESFLFIIIIVDISLK